MSRKKKNNVKSMMTTGVLVVGLVVMLGVVAFNSGKGDEGNDNSKTLQKGGNVIIDKNEVGTNAVFYPYEVEGIELEVMAVKASDGTVRTAFNTCQICYASGRGYYKQQGEALICQNCGNAFTADVNVRRAINIGIDRDELIENVLNGYGTKAYSVCDKMPWYNEACEVEYDKEGAVKLLEEAGWKEGKDGIREKDGVKAELNLMFNTGDSVRQAIAEDVANQLGELGIKVTTEGVGWDVAYDKAQSEPLVWGWGAHTPMELYNIYHTSPDTGVGQAEYSPYANEKVDAYMDQALESDSLEESYELWQKAQWDGENGITQEGDIPWIWLCNVDHLYFVRDGLQVADQKIHPHGHGWSIVNNVDQWSWK